MFDFVCLLARSPAFPRLQGLTILEVTIAALSVSVFLAETFLLHSVWYFKASLAVLMDIKIALLVTGLPWVC